MFKIHFMFKPEYVSNFIGFLLGVVLLTGIISKMFSIKEIVTFSIIISLLFVCSSDIKKGTFKKEKNKFSVKYGIYIGLFCLLTFI